MKDLIFFSTILLLLLMGCDKAENQCSDFPLAISNLSDQEDYLIIESILNEQFNTADLVHICQETHSMSDSSRFAMYFSNDEITFDPEKIEEYILQNSSSFLWGESFEREQELISKQELECLFTSNGWTNYYSKYTNSTGYLKFGKPIRMNEEAIITYEYLCNGECGTGYTVTLKKENGTWIVKQEIVVWIS